MHNSKNIFTYKLLSNKKFSKSKLELNLSRSLLKNLHRTTLLIFSIPPITLHISFQIHPIKKKGGGKGVERKARITIARGVKCIWRVKYTFDISPMRQPDFAPRWSQLGPDCSSPMTHWLCSRQQTPALIIYRESKSFPAFVNPREKIIIFYLSLIIVIVSENEAIEKSMFWWVEGLLKISFLDWEKCEFQGGLLCRFFFNMYIFLVRLGRLFFQFLLKMF